MIAKGPDLFRAVLFDGSPLNRSIAVRFAAVAGIFLEIGADHGRASAATHCRFARRRATLE